MKRSFFRPISWRGLAFAACLAATAASCGTSSSPTSPGGGSPGGGSPGNTCYIITGETTTSFPASGGSAQISVTAADTCSWTATSSQPFLTISSGNSGVGSGLVKFTMAPNTGVARFAILTITGTDIEIKQAGATGLR